MLTVKSFVEGPIDANNYLITDEDSKEAALIDCSSSRLSFIEQVKNCGIKLKYILLTHGHFDHILGIEAFKKEFNTKPYISQFDLEQVRIAPQMLSYFGANSDDEIPQIKNFVNDGDEFKIGDTVIKAISTPGHTKGGMCYIIQDKLFSGDTLFNGSVGRCDMLGGDFNELRKSIKEKIFNLPDNTEVYTGHGPVTTIGNEKKYNEIINM